MTFHFPQREESWCSVFHAHLRADSCVTCHNRTRSIAHSPASVSGQDRRDFCTSDGNIPWNEELTMNPCSYSIDLNRHFPGTTN